MTATAKRSYAPLVEYDAILSWVALLLLSIGLVMVYSASIATAEASKYTHQSTFYLLRQSIFIVIGFIAGVVAFQMPVRGWQKLSPWLFLVGVALLLLVLIPGIGKVVYGSRRWLSLFVFNLQPSELMKLFAVLYAADYTVRKSNVGHLLTKAFLPMAAVMGVVGTLLLLEPDMGAFVVIFAIAFCILWLGGFNLKVFAGLMIVLPLGFAALVLSSEYRMKRVTGFMDPWSDPYGKGYQLSHALIAFGRGEWTGVGLGGSVEKLFYLPEAHTDFLMAVIGEELGFVGVLVVMSLIAWFVARAYMIGRQAAFMERPFAALVAQGIAVWIGFQSMINIGVNMGVLPTKGLTLPFLSFGGSGIVVNCVSVAILLRIDYENRRLSRGLPA
ncbi:putative peptidoglycan glycosyltransferase FtsW [Ferriphaselus amnicola]|uniref:Probable peptidoglycan glycosyltransferase FtsW n=1 Tax=Ferriphaselus amnicola TaxID=1188319 RepID=A0A2Z6G8K6_9PROT|nr:putative lipid II flippase FtsW [Ferriphaselus amnicola]BBE49811.1 putative peptidoglycan glycosyltransferase FtsW [Ferriphaselus amnicola]